MHHVNETQKRIIVSNITSVTVFLSSFFDLTWADCTIFNEPVLTACWPFTSCFVFEAYSHQSFHFKLSFVSTSAIKLHGNTPSFVSICMRCNHSIWTNFQLESAQRTQTSTKTPNLNRKWFGIWTRINPDSDPKTGMPVWNANKSKIAKCNGEGSWKVIQNPVCWLVGSIIILSFNEIVWLLCSITAHRMTDSTRRSPILQSWEKIKSNLESVSGTNQHQKLISSNWSTQS